MAAHRDRVGRVVLTACDAYEHFPPRTALGRLFTPVFSGPGLAALARDPAAGRPPAAGPPAPRHTLAAAEANRDFPHPVVVARGDDELAALIDSHLS